MARRPSGHVKRESDDPEREIENPFWSIASGSSSSSTLPTRITVPSAYDQQSIARSSSSSFWTVPVSSQEHVEANRHIGRDFPPSHEASLPQYDPMEIPSTKFPWQIETELDRKPSALTIQAGRRISDFSNVEPARFHDSGFIGFQQCLQEGMNMNPSDYSDLSRAIGTSLESSFPGSAEQERPSSSFSAFAPKEERTFSSFPGFGSEGMPLSSAPIASGFLDYSSSIVADQKALARTARPSTGGTSTVPGTPISSASSSSSDGHEEDHLMMSGATLVPGSVATAEEATPDIKFPEEAASEVPSSDSIKKP